MKTPIDRRDALAAAAGLALAPLLGRSRAHASAAPLQDATAAKPFRLIHMTDIHVQPERQAERGAAQAWARAQELKPDLVITGGDTVMDVFDAKRDRAKVMRGCYESMMKDVSAPVLHTTGNHDILGWNRSRTDVPLDAADWGKKWACETFAQPRTWFSSDRGGWRFILLDSVQPDGNGYKGFLDPEQRAWFEAELAKTPAGMPVCVVSHIPIIAVTAITYGKPPARGKDTILSGGEMHTDCAELHEVMRASGKVRLCLSGHIHLRDRCETDGITYINDGAVSGSWWKGALEGVPEGFGVIDLRPDGTFDHRYETYGWTARD
jgi:3',5'-cyclic AMP phosphodiesterase CpdA